MIAANLIPLPRREARRRLVRTHRWYLAWALTGAGLAAAVAVAAASWNTDTATPAAALAALEKQNDALAAQVKRATTEISEARRDLTASRAVGEQPDWSVLLHLIDQQVAGEPGLRLRQIRLKPQVLEVGTVVVTAKPGAKPAPPPPAPEPAFVLSLRGVAPSQTAVSKLVLGLERTTLFRRVEMLESKRADPDPARPTQELVMFYIECRFATKAPTP